jgi:PKD repeat protein
VDNGTYTVTVKVTDDDGGMDSNNSSHQVDNVAPVVAVPGTSPEPSDEGSSVTASAAFTDAGTLDTHQCTVDYGDGGGDEAATVLSGVCTGPTHIYADNGSYTVTVKVTDNDGGMGSNSSSHQVDNVAPVVAVPIASPEPSDEGSSVIASATFSDVGVLDTHQCTVDYGDGSGEQAGTALNEVCTGPGHTYLDNGTYTVTVKVTDNDGGMGSNSSSHQVNNVAPSGLTFSATPVDENGSTTLTGSFTDPGTLDTFELDIGWGDPQSPGNTQNVELGTDRSFSIDHQYLDDNPSGTPSDIYIISVMVTDDDNGSTSDTGPVTVNNVAPVVAAPTTSPEPSDEGSSVIASATFTDVGTLDTHQCTVDYGDGSGPEAATVLNGVCAGPAHTYADNGLYTVTVSVIDDDTGVGSNSSSHQVNNVAPLFTASSNSAEACGVTPADGTVEVSAEFGDPGFDWPLNGTVESFTATIDWGDGTVEAGQVDSETGSEGILSTGLVSGSHVYTNGGIFTVTITVEDDDGGSDTTTFEALVTGVSLNDGELSAVGSHSSDWIDLASNRRRIQATLQLYTDLGKEGTLLIERSVPLRLVQSIRIMGCEGDDQISVARSIEAATEIDGGDDNDTITSGNGVTLLEGGPGDDTLTGGDGGNTINGGPGEDELIGGNSADVMSGGDGDDTIHALRGDDYLDGGDDTDLCVPGPGVDTVVNCEPPPPKSP